MKEQADRANDFIDFIAKSPTKYKQYKIKTTETQFHSFVFRQ